MSIAAMSRVWSESQHKGNALLLLLAIADNADDSGWCWPGIQYLARKVKVTPQSIIRITKKLEQSLELTVLHNRRTGNKYVIRLGMTDAEIVQVLKAKAPYLDDEQITNILLHNTHVTSEVTDNVSSEVTPVLHESSRTIKEPSVNSTRVESPTLDLQIQHPPKAKKNGKPRDNDLYHLARALADVCVLDFEANKPRVFAEAKRLSKVTPRPTPDLLKEHYGKGGTWYKQDWRGRKDQRPTLGQPRQTWLQLAVEDAGPREFTV